MRYKRIVNPFSNAAIGYSVGGGVIASHALSTKIIVRMNGHDHWNFLSLGDVRQPQGNMHQCISREARVLFTRRQVNLDEMFFVRECLVGSIHGELSSQRIHWEVHCVTKFKGSLPPFPRESTVFFGRLCEVSSKRHCEHEDGDGNGDGRSG